MRLPYICWMKAKTPRLRMSEAWRKVLMNRTPVLISYAWGRLVKQCNDIETMTIRELRALASRLGVDPVTLLPECGSERVTTARGATS